MLPLQLHEELRLNAGPSLVVFVLTSLIIKQNHDTIMNFDQIKDTNNDLRCTFFYVKDFDI